MKSLRRCTCWRTDYSHKISRLIHQVSEGYFQRQLSVYWVFQRLFLFTRLICCPKEKWRKGHPNEASWSICRACIKGKQFRNSLEIRKLRRATKQVQLIHTWCHTNWRTQVLQQIYWFSKRIGGHKYFKEFEATIENKVVILKYSGQTEVENVPQMLLMMFTKNMTSYISLRHLTHHNKMVRLRRTEQC